MTDLRPLTRRLAIGFAALILGAASPAAAQTFSDAFAGFGSNDREPIQIEAKELPGPGQEPERRLQRRCGRHPGRCGSQDPAARRLLRRIGRRRRQPAHCPARSQRPRADRLQGPEGDRPERLLRHEPADDGDDRQGGGAVAGAECRHRQSADGQSQDRPGGSRGAQERPRAGADPAQ